MTVYENFVSILNGGRNPARRTIAGPRATVILRKSPDVIALKYQATEVITAREDGRVILDSGGWRTVTTKARINEYGPGGFAVYQSKGIWTLYGSQIRNLATGEIKRQTWSFADGIMINEATGRVSCYGDRDKDLALRKSLKRYVSQYYDAMADGTLGKAPGGGDCIFCLYSAQGGKVSDPGGAHLRSHLEESYLVPSLGISVLKEGYGDGKPTIGTFLSKYAAYALQETLRTGEPIQDSIGIERSARSNGLS